MNARRFIPTNGKLVWTAVVTSLVGAAISSGFALRMLQVGIEPVTRPDKFTGTEGKALQAQIDALNVRVARLEAK